MRSAGLPILIGVISIAVPHNHYADDAPPFGKHDEPVSAIAFSADGKYLAVANAAPDGADEATQGTIKIFGSAGNVVHELKTPAAGNYALSISPDAKLLAAVHPSVEGNLWGLAEGQNRGEIPECSSRAVFISNDRLLLLRYGSLLAWDVKQGKRSWVREFKAPQGKWNSDPTTALSVSHDGKWLAANGGDRTVKLWDISSGELKHELAGHTAMIVSLEFAPDDTTVVSTAGGEKSSGELIVWKVESGEQQCGLEHLQGRNNTIHSASFSPDGTLLAWTAGGNQIEICDANTCVRKGVIRSRPLAARQLTFAPDGKWLASIDDAHKLKLWEVSTALKPAPTTRAGN